MKGSLKKERINLIQLEKELRNNRADIPKKPIKVSKYSSHDKLIEYIVPSVEVKE